MYFLVGASLDNEENIDNEMHLPVGFISFTIIYIIMALCAMTYWIYVTIMGVL